MKQSMMALISGALVGFGLALSQMIDRERILGFLDITGTWDPTLIFVLGGAVGVTVIAFRFVLRRPVPLTSEKFYLPTRRDVDRPLIVGSAIFGIGWGIAGYCPGPALSSLSLFSWNPIIFLVALTAGSLTYKWISDNQKLKPAGNMAQSAASPVKQSSPSAS